jgi:formate dehydrogenase subunit gamma
MRAPPSWDPAIARDIIEAHRQLDGATLPILHALQDRFGYVDPAADALIAEALNLSLAEIRGVVSFYHDFRRSPPGRRVIRLCRAEDCQAVGCEDLVAHAAACGLPIDATTADVTFETVYCLGNCALGPAALVDGALIGRLTPAKLDQLRAGRPA